MASAPVAHASGATILVELAVEMQPLEHQLDGAGDLGGIALAAKLLDRRSEPSHFGRLTYVLEAAQRVADVDLQAVVEARQELIELVQGEVTIEDVQHRLLHEFVDDLFFIAVAHGLQLDLAARALDQRD